MKLLLDSVATEDLFDGNAVGRWLTIDGERYEVSGLSWMDHEFSTSFLEPEQRGWDWFAINLDDGTDLFDVGWQTDGREAYVVSEPTGASTFFPVNDHPTDKAAYTIAVTVPQGLEAISNGVPAFRKPKSQNAATTLRGSSGMLVPNQGRIRRMRSATRRSMSSKVGLPPFNRSESATRVWSVTWPRASRPPRTGA